MTPEYLPSLPAIANHLWQCTFFAGVAGLMTLTLRTNHARIRHQIWLAASIKFLIPLSLLVGLSAQIRWLTAADVNQSRLAVVVNRVSEPFRLPDTLSPLPAGWSPASGADPLKAVVWAVWFCGFAGISASWWNRWRRVRAAYRSGVRVNMQVAIEAVCSSTALEPGVFGLFRPVLLLPEGIFKTLTPAQLEAVIAHELCHVRRRDNLTAAIQMFVEAVFWFHPLVWWIGNHMLEERERACDEEVVNELSGRRRLYADAILSVCKLYVGSPLECVSGVAGSNLRKRIEEIMTERKGQNMNYTKKCLLAATTVAALGVPLIVGVSNARPARAQTGVTVATAPQPHPHQPLAPEPPIGTFVNGRFHHALTGTEFSLPVGWTVSYQGESSGGGEQIGFVLGEPSGTLLIDAFVWMKSEARTADEIPGQLRSAVDYKAGMREGMMPAYKMLTKTIERKAVGGQLALSVLAEFRRGNEKMIEYHTWITSTTNHVYLSARMRAADFDALKVKVDQILDSMLVP